MVISWPGKRFADKVANAHKGFGMLTDQFKELTALGQKIANSSAQPITRSFRGFSP